MVLAWCIEPPSRVMLKRVAGRRCGAMYEITIQRVEGSRQECLERIRGLASYLPGQVRILWPDPDGGLKFYEAGLRLSDPEEQTARLLALCRHFGLSRWLVNLAAQVMWIAVDRNRDFDAERFFVQVANIIKQGVRVEERLVREERFDPLQHELLGGANSSDEDVNGVAWALFIPRIA